MRSRWISPRSTRGDVRNAGGLIVENRKGSGAEYAAGGANWDAELRAFGNRVLGQPRRSGLLTMMPTFETMFLARVIEGVGAACISAKGGVLAISLFPWNQRGQVLRIIGTAVARGPKFGPVVGGFLSDHFGGRSAFLVNPALGIIFVILGSRGVQQVEGFGGVGASHGASTPTRNKAGNQDAADHRGVAMAEASEGSIA